MRQLVESCFRLDTKLLKKDLRKARKREPVEGYLNVIERGKSSILDYQVEYEGEDNYLVLTFGIEPQRILLSEHELPFGTRSYYICGCGCRTSNLYLNNGIFACRKCHKLSYESTTINRKSKHGQFLYRNNRIIRIMNERESMNRIFYKGVYTKRFNRWLGLCDDVGLVNEIMAAKELITAINSQSQ